MHCTKKMKFPIEYFFSKCDQIRSLPRIWSHLLKKFLMQSFIFCAVMFWYLFHVAEKNIRTILKLWTIFVCLSNTAVLQKHGSISYFVFLSILWIDCHEWSWGMKLNEDEEWIDEAERCTETAVQMFFKIGVLKNFTTFTGKHLCSSLFLI